MSEESNAINELTIGIGIASRATTEALLALQAVQGRAAETAKETRDSLDALCGLLQTIAECVSPGRYGGINERDPEFRVRHFIPEARENE